MAKHIKLLLIVTVALISNTAFAQVFTLSGEYRPRAEYYHGYKTLANKNQKPAFSVSQRTRLNLAFEMENIFSTYLSIQDVRTWGSQSQLVANEANGISLHEAWGEVYFGKKKMGVAKFGRQEIIYDDHRIFGNVGWLQQARSHDALILKYRNKSKVEFHLGAAYNQDGPMSVGTVYTVPNSYKTLQYIWLHKDFEKQGLSISLLALNIGLQASDTNTLGEDVFKVRFNQTFGTHVSYTKSKFKLLLNAYMQTGQTAQVYSPLKILGFLASADASYEVAKGLRLHLGYEFISGNSQTSVDPNYYLTNHSFTPHFGTNHKFNGFMDYFYVGNHAGSVGLQDAYLKIKYKHKKFNIGGDFHAFLTASELRNPTTINSAASPYLGTELDFYAGYAVAKYVSLTLGYSQLIASKSMEYLKGGDKNAIHNWGYLAIAVNPTFFKSKKKEKEE